MTQMDTLFTEKTSKNGKWKSIKTTSSTSYTNKKLKLNKTYWYKIRAFEGSGKSKTYSPYSKTKSGVPRLQTPSFQTVGSATSIKRTADSILETKAITNGILAKHTGKTVKEIDKATAFDNFMNAKEAVEFGICDEIRNIF